MSTSISEKIRDSIGIPALLLMIFGVFSSITLFVLFVDKTTGGFDLVFNYLWWGFSGALAFFVVSFIIQCVILVKNPKLKPALRSAIRGVGEVLNVSRAGLYGSMALSAIAFIVLGALMFQEDYILFWVIKSIVGVFTG